jgi:hypothetical protein
MRCWRQNSDLAKHIFTQRLNQVVPSVLMLPSYDLPYKIIARANIWLLLLASKRNRHVKRNQDQSHMQSRNQVAGLDEQCNQTRRARSGLSLASSDRATPLFICFPFSPHGLTPSQPWSLPDLPGQYRLAPPPDLPGSHGLAPCIACSRQSQSHNYVQTRAREKRSSAIGWPAPPLTSATPSPTTTMTQGRTTPSSSSTITGVYGFIPSCIKSCVVINICKGGMFYFSWFTSCNIWRSWACCID